MNEHTYRVTTNLTGGKDMRLAGTVLARVYYKLGSGPPLELRVRVKDLEAYEKLLTTISMGKPFYKDEYQVLNLREIAVVYVTFEYEGGHAQT